ncbi:MAG: PAS domain S-box protein [Salinirussus sp.]
MTSIRVLHVDDDPSVREQSTALLGRTDDIAVRTAPDGRSALDLFGADEFDCVVSEYDLPAMDGVELYRALGARSDDPVPFVLYTDDRTERVASEAVRAGVSDYLPKREGGPGRYERLAERIRAAVGDDAKRRLLADGADPDRYAAAGVDPEQVSPLRELGDPAFALDGDGEFLFVNERLCGVVGRDPVELLGAHYSTITAQTDIEAARQALARLASEPGTSRQRYRKRLTGVDERLQVEVTLSEAQLGGTRAFLGVARETDAARGVDSRFRVLFDNIPDAALSIEYVDGEPIIKHVNDAFEETFGYDDEAAAGESVNDLLVPDEHRAEAREIDEEVRRGGAVSREVRRETAGGERRDFLFRSLPAAETGETSLIYGTYTDITERKQYERKLEALHTNTRELMAADSVEAVATTGVSAARSILGHDVSGVHLYDEEEDRLVPAAVTDSASDLFDPVEPLEASDSIAGRVYETGEPVTYEDVREEPGVHNPDTPVRSEMLLPLGDHGVWIVSSTDVGAFDESDLSLGRVLAANIEAALDQRKRERALQESKQALRRQNERLDEFASMVSHDLRNPLGIAEGHLTLAADEHDSEHLDRVAEAHERMATLIEDVLTWAREGEAVESTEPVAVEGLAADCWRDLSVENADIDVETDLTVLADRSRLRQLLENLLQNAVEHGSTSPRSQASDDAVEHGSTSPRSQAPDDAVEGEDSAAPDVTVRVGALPDGSGFFVADDGPGIPPEERDEVFESGYALSEDGSGYGLAIVEQIVTAHGWSIEVTDSESGGARFEITGVESP